MPRLADLKAALPPHIQRAFTLTAGVLAVTWGMSKLNSVITASLEEIDELETKLGELRAEEALSESLHAPDVVPLVDLEALRESVESREETA